MSAARYVKRPIVVEAIQWTGDNLSEIWDAFGAGQIYGPTEKNPDHLIISTLEGDMRAGVGCWILRGHANELYPCRDDIFRATYEPVAHDSGHTAAAASHADLAEEAPSS